MIDPGGASDQPVRVNARTWRAVMAQVGLAALFACWMELYWSVPHFGVFWSQGSDRSAWEAALWPVIFLVIWRVALGRTVEWTIAGDELRRRSWFSRPGSKPSAVTVLGPGVEVVHEIRGRWRVWPNGCAIDVWFGRTSRLIRAMERAGVRVDDFRGDWERQHRRLSTLALLAYCGAIVSLLATPAVGIAVGSGLPLVPIVAAVGLLFLGQKIDRLAWTSAKPSPQDG